MSLPKSIHDTSNRRRSMAKLTRSPLSSSPIVSLSPRFGSKTNSFSAQGNAQFMKKFAESGDVHSSDSSKNEVFQPSDDDYEGHPNNQRANLDSLRVSASGDAQPSDLATGIKDPKISENINKYLSSDTKGSIQNPGGDMTRDIYRIVDNQAKPKRARSFSGSEVETGSRRGSMASSINVPGGFRRDFIMQNKSPNIRTQNPNLITRNFVEFLSIYGHFAGEDLEDEDDIACHYKPFTSSKYGEVDEESPLLTSSGMIDDDDNDDDPFEYTKVNPVGTATDTKAYFLLLKAFVGTGVLFLPKGFSNGGLLFSILVLSFFGMLSLWCYLVLVFSKQATRVSSFGEIGLKLYGKWLQQLIFTSIVISQIGFIATYIVFTSQNLQAFLRNLFGIDNIDITWFVLGQLVVLVPLSLIRDITRLSLAAVLANFLILLGLVTIIYFVLIDLFITHSGEIGEGIVFLVNAKEFSMFIGIAIFAFEGIGLIIPIQESMIYPNHFPKVLSMVIVSISIIMVGVGTLGYMTYGKDIQTVILLNLPQNSPFVMMIQLFYSLAILLSTPIQIFPAIRLIELKLFTRTGKYSLKTKWLKNLFRFTFVLATAIIALYGGKLLDRFVSFVGCFACIPLVYMYPPLLHLKSCCNYDNLTDKREISRRYWLGILNYILTIIGACALVYTTYDILSG